MKWWWVVYAGALVMLWTIPFDHALNAGGIYVPVVILGGVIGLTAVYRASLPRKGR